MVNWNIINLWIDDHNKPCIKPHCHNWHEIIYFNKGKVKIHIDGSEYEVDEGTFIIIPRKIKHDEIRYGDTQTVCLIFISEDNIKPEILKDNSGEILAHLMLMNSEARAKPYRYVDILNLKLQELYIMIERARNADSKISKDFSYAINYISDNYREKINFPEFSKRLNMSYSYFRHHFKSLCGMSPQNFLIEKRLMQAEKMLINRELNCTEIAYYCGFSNSAQFTDMFKRKYGITPTKYRKNRG